MQIYTVAFVGPWAGDYCEEDDGVTVHATAEEAFDAAVMRWTAYHDAAVANLRLDGLDGPALDVKEIAVADLLAGTTVALWNAPSGERDAFLISPHELEMPAKRRSGRSVSHHSGGSHAR